MQNSKKNPDTAFLLQEAIESGDVRRVEKVLESIPNVNVAWGSGINIFHYYVGEASKLKFDPNQIIKILVDSGVQINAKDEKGNTPLHHAVSFKNLEVVKALVSKGSDIDAKNKTGNTALWRAVQDYRGERELLEIIKELVRAGANIDEKNNFGHSPRSIVVEMHKSMENTQKPREWDLQPHLNW